MLVALEEFSVVAWEFQLALASREVFGVVEMFSVVGVETRLGLEIHLGEIHLGLELHLVEMHLVFEAAFVVVGEFSVVAWELFFVVLLV